jgi:hypothetical protein
LPQSSVRTGSIFSTAPSHRRPLTNQVG